MTQAHFIPTERRVLDSDQNPYAGRSFGAPGDVLAVYGAPGTGKTTALVEHFQALVLMHGLAPEQILVLPATRDGAAALRDRLLLSLAGQVGAEAFAVEGALARTVSSLAFAIVRQHSLANGLPLPELISGPDQDAIFVRLLAAQSADDVALWPKHISAATLELTGFRAELRDLLASCQEHGLNASGLANLSGGRPEWAAAARLFERYEELMASVEYAHRYDPPTMVNRAIELLELGAAAPEIRAILVDDAQELTPSSARFIRQLAGSSAGVALFGDPDSSTLGFRQADPRLMSSLAAELAGARGGKPVDVVLDTDPWGKPNGTGPLMANLSGLIGARGAVRHRVVHSQAATDESGSALKVSVFPSSQNEAEALAYSLRALHLQQGVPWGELAVVARTRGQLDWLERALAAEGVPTRIQGAQHALRDEFASREILELAAFCTRELELDAATAERFLRSPFCGLDSVAMRRLRRRLRQEELSSGEVEGSARNSDELLVELFLQPNAATTLKGTDAARIRRFLKSLVEARELLKDPDQTIEDLLWEIWKPSGLAEAWSELARNRSEVAAQANRNLDAIVALFSAANRFVERNPGARPEVFIAAQLDQSLPEDSISYSRRAEQFVNLLTPAGLVGRRYHTVAVAQLIEGIWPNLKPRNSLLNAGLLSATVTGRLDEGGQLVRAEMADELRMFYKAVGAANSLVWVSSYLSEEEQVSQFLAHAAGGAIPAETEFRTESLTLRSMAGKLRRQLATATDEQVRAELAVKLGRLAEAGVPGAHPDDWYGLAQLSSNEPLFEFLDSIPDGEAGYDRGPRISVNPSQFDAFVSCPLHWFLKYHGGGDSDFSATLGSLVHRAAELASSHDEAALWEQVESSWHSLRFESSWQEQSERRKAKRLIANLAEYLGAFGAAGGRLLAAEQEFELDLGRAHIRGKVDRIEQLTDGGVVIVDLKSSKTPPSKEKMLEHPQLGLYQLAYVNGAFREVALSSEADLAGGKLVLLGDNKPKTPEQVSIAQNPEGRKYFEDLLQEVAQGMAMPQNIFIARVSEHCTADRNYGSCQLHLHKAVSFVG